MTNKEINTDKYFVELTDIGGGTIGYTVPFPEELLRKIIKQNKQLKRKTQECESLKEEIEVLKDNFDTATRDCNELIEELKQECEELKEKYLNLKEQNGSFIVQLNTVNERLDQLKAENEELKKKCNIYTCGICGNKDFTLYDLPFEIKKLSQECENLKVEEKYLKQCCQKAGEELAKHSFEYDGKEKNLVVQAIELNEKYNKLQKALEEIEKVINNILNSCLGRNTVSCRPAHNVCGDSIKILDIINKAKGGK